MANKTEKTLEQLLDDLKQAQQAYEIAKQLDEKKKKEAEENKKAELAAIKEKRYQEIKEVENKLIELKKAYIKDYGKYESEMIYNDNAIPYLLKLFSTALFFSKTAFLSSSLFLSSAFCKFSSSIASI